MRFARKLFLLTAMAVTAFALTAGSASAQETPKTALTEAGDPCGTVTLVGHDAQGGCHVTFQSDVTGIPLHAYIPAKTTISNCDVDLEGRIGTNGEGWIDEITLTNTGIGVPCTRTECDEPAGPNHNQDNPWPFHVVEHSSGEEEVEAVFCLRPANTIEGTAGNRCEVHLEFTDLGGHNYEAGHLAGAGREAFCENNPPNGTTHPTLPFPLSIEGHLTTVGTEEAGTVEIVHD
jgi:hypothetical protein